MSLTETTRTTERASIRDNSELLGLLTRIADEGWDGSTGRRLLTFVRERLARPLAVGAGLRGLAASQAEASAWQAAWEVLAFRDLTAVDEPWGVVWRAAHRAVAAEVVAARFGDNPSRAWRTAKAGIRPLVGLDVIVALGLDAVAEEREAFAVDLGCAYRESVIALNEVGWSQDAATRIVAAVADLPGPGVDSDDTCVGWRTMASTLALPPWQARRLCITLLGTASWPGLLARMLLDGVSARRAPAMQAALRSTRVRRLRSPILAAERAEAAVASPRPQSEAA